MAPKAGKAKPHKTKGEKKKKEEKVLPTVVDITVETPDYTQLTLKVKRETSWIVVSLCMGCTPLLAEEYTEELAVGHVRRFLDIVACTTAFASKNGSPRAGSSPKDPDAHAGGAPDSAAKAPSKSPRSPRAASSGGIAGGSGGQKDEPMYPPPKLAQFYDFFSFAHLSPPFQCEGLQWEAVTINGFSRRILSCWKAVSSQPLFGWFVATDQWVPLMV
ncbi:hypothetical protein J5N97_026907 [Dioscorea zingiberensis]|uniref:Uncharacterized protein n=1 Tax=Dioscorea zingiberensis TaxID=325984 RepID=A0A9D5C3Z4_9LILI|nr:hypothetical protein J5N97_026907 [Dioscorea zingiberensis]